MSIENIPSNADFTVGSLSVYISRDIPEVTRQKVRTFVQEQEEGWLVEQRAKGSREASHWFSGDTKFYWVERKGGSDFAVVIGRR